jgi:putative transcriptional regulator
MRRRRPPTRFRWARARAGLSQAELAAAVYTSRETISSIEREQSIPSVGLAILIAHRLEQPVESLFDVERDSL